MSPGIGIGISNALMRGGEKLPSHIKSDILSDYTIRNGLYFSDPERSKSAEILPASALFNSTGNDYLILSDIITLQNGEIELYEYQPIPLSSTAQGFLFGEGGNDWLNFRTSTTISVRIQGTLKSFTCSNISTTGFNKIKMLISTDTTTKVRIFCNDIESSSGEQDYGAIKTFYIQNICRLSGSSSISSLIIKEEGTTILEMYPSGLGKYEYDVSGYGNTATWSGTNATIYLSGGTEYYFQNGFTIYEKVGENDEYVPYGGDISILTNTLERVGYFIKKVVDGYEYKHNLYPSLIVFTDDSFDRSDTEIFEDDARTGYYDSLNPGRWHTSEFNQKTFKSWLKAAYQEIIFTKFFDNTIDTGFYLQEIIVFNTVKTGTDLISVLNYTKYKFSPEDLVAEFIVDIISVHLTWTDSYSGVAQYEIWRAYNGADKELIALTDAGAVVYNDQTCKQNLNVRYWIRAKLTSGYSAFSSSDIFTTPLCFKTDQSVLTDVVFWSLTINPDKPVTVNWGDGNTNVLTSTYNNNLTHSYSETGQYNIWLTGGVDSIINMEAYEQVHLYGDITNWIFPYRMLIFHCYKTGLTGDVTDHANWFSPNILVYDAQYLQITGDVSGWRFKNTNIYDVHFEYTLVTGDITNWDFTESEVTSASAKLTLFNSLLTGDISSWQLFEGINWLNIRNTALELDITNFYIPSTLCQIDISTVLNPLSNLSGDLSNFIFPTTPSAIATMAINIAGGDLTGDMRNCLIPAFSTSIKLNFASNKITHLPRGNFRWIETFIFTGNECDADELDDFLAYVDNYFSGGIVPLSDAQYELTGTNMGTISASGSASRASILAKYAAAGKSCTIHVKE